MSAPNVIAVKSWMDLAREIEAVEERRIYGQPKLFRGVTNYREHKLVPKIGRPGAKKNPTNGQPLPHSESDERAMIDLFMRTVPPYLSRPPARSRLLEWLAIAQHHGAPTRLLDWTQSPLAAAYFAMEKAGTEGQPAIYVLDAPPTANEKANPFELADVMAYYPPHISPRIQVQRSVFTVHPCPSSEYQPEGLMTWLFPQDLELCWQIKRMVDTSGFNRGSLFPDLVGQSEHVGWCYKWGRF